MDLLKVEIDPQNNSISVWNNGQGIPVEIHKEEKCWVKCLHSHGRHC